MSALSAWSDALAAWALPPAIVERAEESPWVLPRQVFVRRSDRQITAPTGATYDAAVAALDRPGTVLDVGAGAGAASLALVGRAPVTGLVAVDTDAELLAALTERASMPVRTVHGWWPDVAPEAGTADVVICAHVLYNIADLAPFVAALTAASRRRVVAELTERHPLTTLNPLWERFHGIKRPDGPTADDCIAALGEVGIRPAARRWRRPATPEYGSLAELVDTTRRRLCLPASAAGEVEAALLELGVDPGSPIDLGSSGRSLVTLIWDGTAAGIDLG